MQQRLHSWLELPTVRRLQRFAEEPIRGEWPCLGLSRRADGTLVSQAASSAVPEKLRVNKSNLGHVQVGEG